MKKYILLILLLSSFIGFSQSINDYKYVIVPSKFSFLKEKDKYGLNNLTKLFMEKYGFVVYYDTDTLPVELANQNCNKAYVDVVSSGNMFMTKLTVLIKDCQNKVLYTSEEGKSREKEFKVAYTKALREALNSLNKMEYKYIDKSTVNSKVNTEPNNNIITTNVESEVQLFAQPITNGFQLIDSTPKVVLKIYTTSNPSCFIAIKETISGVLISKDNLWFFEYYENEKLISEKVNVKF